MGHALPAVTGRATQWLSSNWPGASKLDYPLYDLSAAIEVGVRVDYTNTCKVDTV